MRVPTAITLEELTAAVAGAAVAIRARRVPTRAAMPAYDERAITSLL